MSGSVNAELLVILDPRAPADTRAELERKHALMHAASPRVLVVQQSVPDPGSVSALSGVLLATAGDIPETVLATLSVAEQQWVAAWQLRRRGKARIGEGLAWDAPGFSAPDQPDPSTGSSGQSIK
jgi:hypothetical protein